MVGAPAERVDIDGKGDDAYQEEGRSDCDSSQSSDESYGSILFCEPHPVTILGTAPTPRGFGVLPSLPDS
nr:hypothetical protein CPGR_04583 [Mycolicibacterium komanii]